MKRRTFMAGLAGAGVMLPLSRGWAAAPASDVTATLSLYRPSTEVDVAGVNHAIERFKNIYPNVTVNVTYVSNSPWSDYINQFLNMMTSGQPADIVSMPTEGIAALASRGLVHDLNGLVEPEYLAQLEADIEPNLFSAVTYKDTRGFVPTEWHTVVMYYNTKMFEEAGLTPPTAEWTWDDFLVAADKLTVRDASGAPTRYGYVVPGTQFILTPWLFTNDTDRLTPDGLESNVQDPKFKETLVFLHDLIFKHKVAPAFVKGDIGQAPFLADQSAMFSGVHSAVRVMSESGYQTADVQKFPRNKTDTMVCGVQGIGITKASAQPELAWQFAKLLTDLEFASGLAQQMRAIPARRSGTEQDIWRSFPRNAEIFYGSASTARALVAPPNFPEVEEIMMRHIDSYLTGNAEIDPTIENMHSELSRAMSRVK